MRTFFSLLAGLLVAISSLFTTHTTLNHQVQTASAAAPIVQEDSGAYATPTTTPFTTSPATTSTTPTRSYPTSQPSGNQDTALVTKVNTLSAVVNNLLTLIPTLQSTPVTAPTPDSAVQQELSALQREISQSNQITNLSNVTIQNPVISNLSASNIPDLSGIYLALHGGALTGALTTTNSIQIGTTTSSALFTVDSASATGTILRIANDSTGGHTYDFLETGSANSGGAGRLDFFDKTANATRLSIASNGNIGIATTTPGSILSVAGVANWTTSTSTYYSAGGINLNGGCFAVAGTCVTGSGGGGGGGTASGLTSTFTVDTGQSVTAGSIVALLQDGNVENWTGSVSAGTPTLVTSAGSNTNAPLVVNLDATHFIYAYRDSANGNKLTAIAGLISGTSVTFGTPVVFSNSTATLATNAIATTSATSFVISYTDSNDASKIKVIAGSISSDTILTFGTPVTASQSINTPVMVMLASTQFVLTYADSTNSNQMYSVAGSVNTGTNVVSIGTPVLASANTNALLTSGLLNGNGGVVALDSAHFLIAYRDSSSSAANKMTAIVGSVSSNTITFGSSVVASANTNTLPLNTWGTNGPITVIDSAHVLISYWDSTNSNRLTTIAGFISGTTLSFGTAVQASTVTSTTGLTVVTLLLDSTNFQLLYPNGTALTSIAGFLNGTNNLTISFGTAVGSGTNSLAGGFLFTPRMAAVLDSTHFAYAYPDTSATIGKTVVFSLSGTNNLTTTAGTAVSMPDSGNCSTFVATNDTLTLIDSTHYVITYLPTSCAIRSVAATVSSGTTVTLGTAVTGANTTTTGSVPNALTYLSSGNYLVTYADNTNASKQTALVSNDTSGTITFGTPVVGSGSTQTTLSSAANVSVALNSTQFVTVFNDTNNSSKLSAAIGTLSGGSVTFGSTYLLSTSTTAVTTVELATTTAGFVVAYKDSTNSNKLSVVAASVSGSTITAGTPTFGVSATTNNPVVTRLDGTHFVVTYTDSTNSSYLTSIAGTVSGTTLTFGSSVVVSDSTTNIAGLLLNAAAALDSSHFVLTYVDTTSNSYAAAVVGSVSGTTITFGTPVNTAEVGTPQVAVVSPSNFVLSYIDTTNTTLVQGKLTVIPASVSGTTVTYGSSLVVSNSNGAAYLIAPLNSTQFVLAYVDATNNYKGSVAVGTLSGTNDLTATMGSAVIFGGPLNSISNGSGASGTLFTLTTFGTSDFMIVFNDDALYDSQSGAGADDQLQALASSVSGPTITLGTPVTLEDDSENGGNPFILWSLPILDSTHAILMYKDLFNSGKITADPLVLQPVSADMIGIAASGGSAGTSISVITGGVVTGLSGLTVGQVYYAETNGSLGTTPTAYQVGLAISSTAIILKSEDTIANTNTDQYFGDAVFANGFRITEGQNGLASLIFLNQFGGQIAQLDQDGNLFLTGTLSEMGSLGGDATTTAASIITASFTSATQDLQNTIASLGDTAVRVLGEAVYAANGIFQNIFAQVADIDTANISTLCANKSDGTRVCISGDQLASMLESFGGATAASDASSTTQDASSTSQSVDDTPTFVSNILMDASTTDDTSTTTPAVTDDSTTTTPDETTTPSDTDASSSLDTTDTSDATTTQ